MVIKILIVAVVCIALITVILYAALSGEDDNFYE
jgi:hypothetical protein